MSEPQIEWVDDQISELTRLIERHHDCIVALTKARNELERFQCELSPKKAEAEAVKDE